MKQRNTLSKIFHQAATAVVAGALMMGVGYGIYADNVHQDLQVTVQGTHESLLHKGEGFGFTKTVYETDKGEFANTLSMWNGKFSRSGIDETMQVGKTYNITVQGIGFPLLGKYPNILSATPVPPKPTR